MADMEVAVQKEVLGGLVEGGVEESSFSMTETPDQKINYVLTGETTIEPDPNKVLKFTHEHLFKGYLRSKGLGSLYRAVLRIAVNPALCALWLKELEAILQEEKDLALEELKDCLEKAGGPDLMSLRNRGATEHELEEAGLPAAKLNVVRYAKESEAISELAEVISSLRLRKDDARSDHISKALDDLGKLKGQLNTFIRESAGLHQITSDILTNVGEATKFAREMRTTLDESASEKQQQLETFQLMLPSSENRHSANNLSSGERRMSYAGRASFAHRQSFSAGGRNSFIGDGRKMSSVGMERKMSSVGMERKLSAVGQMGQSFLRAESFSAANVNASMTNLYAPAPVKDEVQIGQMLLKAGITLHKMSRKKPSRKPNTYVFRYEDDLLKWNTKKGASPVIVLSASSGLPKWLDKEKLMKNSWIKKKFSGINDALLNTIKITVGHSLIGTDKFEMLLFSDIPEIAKNVLAGFENLEDKKETIQEENIDSITSQSDAGAGQIAAASFSMKSRSRAKTLVNQTDSFQDEEDIKSKKKKRKSGVEQDSLPQLVKTGERERIPKKSEDRAFMLSILKKNKIFIGLDDKLLDDIVQIMRKVTVTDGMEMAIQGTFATNFYLIQEGRLEAYDEYLDTSMAQTSRLKAVYGGGDYFGDTSLTFKCPFLYSIVARTDCVLWALDQETFFRALSANLEIQKTIETLVEVPIFNALDDGLFSDTVLIFETRTYKPREIIVEENTSATDFYVLMDGQVDLQTQWYGTIIEGVNERVSKSMSLPGQCFGDFEICFKQKHNQRYVAGPNGATMLSLKLEYFENISKFLMMASDISLRMNVLYTLPIFATLTEEQVSDVAESFDFETFTEGSTIIKKGEKGNKFYFLKSGKVSILDEIDGELRMVNQIRGHGSFGELALLSDDTRKAYVIAESDVEVYSLRREDFRKLVNIANDSEAREKLLNVLRGVDALSTLSNQDISVLVEAMECKKVTEGMKLIQAGDINEKLYIISKGELVLTKVRERENATERVRLLRGNFFGDKALLKTETCTFSVTASRLSEVFVLSRQMLETACGSLEDIKQKNKLKSEEETKLAAMTKDDFEDKGIIGRGAFGLVKLVATKKNKKWYAMKSLIKDNIIKKQHQKHLTQEIKMLENLDHEMIMNLKKKWQDDKFIYLLTEVCTGGDLYQEIKRAKGFTEDTCRFYVACLISMFSHLKEKNIVYRDLKPENLLLDDDGYLKLIDFGLAKQLKEGQKAKTLCGTPEYVAPEILLNEGYGPQVDVWSIGILLYEMISTVTPFSAKNSKSVLSNILQKNLQFASKKFANISEDCKDFIESCLKKDKNMRIGNKTLNELKSHAWYKSYTNANWNAIDRKVFPAPFVPSTKPDNMQILEAKPEELQLPPPVNDYELDTIFQNTY